MTVYTINELDRRLLQLLFGTPTICMYTHITIHQLNNWIQYEYDNNNTAYNLQHNHVDTLAELQEQLFHLLHVDTTDDNSPIPSNQLYYCDVVALLSVLNDTEKRVLFRNHLSCNETDGPPTDNMASSNDLCESIELNSMPLRLFITPTPSIDQYDTHDENESIEIDHLIQLEISDTSINHCNTTSEKHIINSNDNHSIQRNMAILSLLNQREQQVIQNRIDIISQLAEQYFQLHSEYNTQYMQLKQQRILHENQLIALDSTRLLLLNDINDSSEVLAKYKLQLATKKLQCTQLQSQYDIITQQSIELPEQIKYINQQLSGHGLSLNSITTTLPVLESTHTELQYGNKAQLERQQVKTTTQIANTEKQLRIIRDDIFMLTKEINALNHANTSANKLTATLASSIPGHHNAIHSSDIKKSKKQLHKEQQIAAMKLSEIELVRTLDQHRTMLVGILSQLQSTQKLNVDSAQRLATAKQSSNQHRTEITQLTEQLHEYENSLSSVPSRLQALQSQLHVHTQSYMQLNETITKANQQLQQNTTKLNTLTEHKQTEANLMNYIIDQCNSIQLIDMQLYHVLQYYNLMIISNKDKINNIICNVQLIDENNYKYTGLLYCNPTNLLFESCCIYTQLHQSDYTHDDHKPIDGVVSPFVEPVAATTPTDQQHTRLHSIQHICYSISLHQIQSIEQVANSNGSNDVILLHVQLLNEASETTIDIHLIGTHDMMIHLLHHIKQYQSNTSNQHSNNRNIQNQWSNELQQLDQYRYTTKLNMISPTNSTDNV